MKINKNSFMFLMNIKYLKMKKIIIVIFFIYNKIEKHSIHQEKQRVTLKRIKLK